MLQIIPFLVLLGLAPLPVSGQAGDSDVQVLKRHQKEDRRALKIQQNIVKQSMRGHEHSKAERRQIKRQMRADRKFLRAGQRDAMISAKAQRKAAKEDAEEVR